MRALTKPKINQIGQDLRVVPKPETPAPAKLVDWCKERIAFFKVPRYIEFVDAFPRTMTKNEIARHELRDRGIGDAWDGRFE